MAGAALLLAALLTQAPAVSADADIAADARCFAVMALAANATEPRAKQAGMMGALLWYGRLSARLPATAIAAAIKAEVRRMDADKTIVEAEAKRCSAEMAGYGEAMQTLGDEMKADGAR